jgi:N-carbamoylputrescine amidase
MPRVALVTDVFFDDKGRERLGSRLTEARDLEATLAVLPEIPLNPWSPATRQAREEDAEEEGGPRAQALSAAARQAKIAVLGGVIARDPQTKTRHNTALAYDASGELVASYRKVHIPREEGYWEAEHYEPGTEPPQVVELSGLRIGIQICSDINRLVGAQMLAAHGAELIVVPRATPLETYSRWRKVFEVAAITSACWVVSVNRPRPEFGVDIGGPSLVVAPDGTVLLETGEPVSTLEIDPSEVFRARRVYPGYLAYPAGVYAAGWKGEQK